MDFVGLTEEIYQKSEEELNQYKIELETDPSSSTLEKIFEQIARTKSYIERVGVIYTGAIKNSKYFSAVLEEMENDYEKKVENLLINDENVRGQKSADMRTAAANLQLIPEYNTIKDWRMKTVKAELYLTTIKNKLDDLIKTYDAISRQFSVLQEMIALQLIIKPRYNPDEIVRLKTHNSGNDTRTEDSI